MVYFLGVSGRIKLAPEKLEELRLRSVPLGLDLQGGVDVLLAIDTDKTRQNKVNEIADDLRKRFRQEAPPVDATVELTSGTDTIRVVVNKADQERTADNILTKMKSDGYFRDYSPGQIKASQPLALQPNSELLRQDETRTVESALKVIRDRVDKLGVTQPVVVQQGASRIRVQIPGQKNPDQVVATVIRPAQLEFRGVHTSTEQDAEGRFQEDSAAFIDVKTGKPQPGKQIPPGYEARLLREQKTDPRTNQQTTTERYMLVKQKTEMTGAMLADSWVTINQASFESPVQVWLEFRPEGAKKFEEITRQYVKKPLAILLDGVVYSYPNVKQVIAEGRCFIEGGFTHEEAKDLSLILKAGALPAEMTTKEKRTVEATLGADSIRSSVHALFLGSFIIAIYMILYYGTAGFIADIAVFINVLIIFAFMKLMNATLTLSGIGGILLTVGMAVDANVLIYERIREELHHGKTLKTAIHLGFARAFSVIFDTNTTTLISGLTLLQFGTGSVKGFALALNIGIFATLFTGLFCTRTLVQFWYDMKGTLSLGRFQWIKDNIFIEFVGLRKYSYVWSGVLFLLCAVYVTPLWHGSHFGVDFEGGVLSDVKLSKPMEVHQFEAKYQDWRIQKVAGENRFMFRTKFVTNNPNTQIPQTQQEVSKRLDQIVGKGQYQILGNDAVGNEVGAEFTKMAIVACLIASFGILFYIGLRFELAFGAAAVIALFHDLIITYGLFNIFSSWGWAGEVTLDVVSALLVILGYSVHDTIIILDRVRENLKLHPGVEFRRIIDMSICESLNRTVMTVSTVIIVLVVMLVMGGAGLHDFALVLLIGIIKGTYSSSFIAAPILYEIHQHARKKRGITASATTTPQTTAAAVRERA